MLSFCRDVLLFNQFEQLWGKRLIIHEDVEVDFCFLSGREKGAEIQTDSEVDFCIFFHVKDWQNKKKETQPFSLTTSEPTLYSETTIVLPHVCIKMNLKNHNKKKRTLILWWSVFNMKLSFVFQQEHAMNRKVFLRGKKTLGRPKWTPDS